MKWTLGLFGALLAASAAAPTPRTGTSTSANMTEEGSTEPITIPTTQNIFEDVVSVTPPDAESIELQHLHDDARFYPDYGDKDPVDHDHFTGSPRIRRQSPDYTDLTYEMYADPTYERRRRDAEEPYRIDLDIPGDSGSSSEAETPRPTSDPDSVSTQITYVIISEDDDEDDGPVVMKSDLGEHSTEVIDLVIPSSDQGTTDSSSSTDSVAERNRILGAIARTIRTKTRRSSDTDGSSSSSVQLLRRKRRQVPYYRLPDFLNYRVGRSISEDSDDTEPDDDQGPNEKDLAMDGTDLKDRVVPLPEFAYEFSELTRPASTYVDGKLQSYYVPDRQKRGVDEETTTEALDVVTASYPLGIDGTKDNLSLPEGNFLGPRIYAKGDLVREEEPAATEEAPPMKKLESVPVGDGSEIDNVYSAPVSNMNLPLIIPVVAPTSYPGEPARIELSVPSGYVPYIIQLSPTNKTDESPDQKEQTDTHEEETTEKMVTPSSIPVPTYLSSVPTIIITPSTPSGNEVSNQTSSLGMMESSEDGPPESSTTAASESLSTAASKSEGSSKQKRADWKSISSAPIGEIEEPQKQTADWVLASNAPTSGIETQTTSSWQSVSVGEEELPRSSTSSWQSVPVGEEELPRSSTSSWQSVPVGEEELPRSSTSSWHSVPAGEEELPRSSSSSWQSIPVGEEELPKSSTARWEPISNAPAGETEVSPASSTQDPTFTSADPVQDAPISMQRSRSGRRMNTIPILEEKSVMSPNGSFSYSYKSGNGIQVQESGYLKKDTTEEGSTDSGGIQTVQGSYSYTAPDGRLISVRYVADKDGFQPEVEDLPNDRN